MSCWWQRKWKVKTDLQCFGQEVLRCRHLVVKSHTWNNDSSILKWRNSLCLPGHLETAALPYRMHVGWRNQGCDILSRFCHQNVMSWSHRFMNQPPSERCVRKEGQRWHLGPLSQGHLAVPQSSWINNSASAAKRAPGTVRDSQPLFPLGKARVKWSLVLPFLSCLAGLLLCVLGQPVEIDFLFLYPFLLQQNNNIWSRCTCGVFPNESVDFICVFWIKP